MKSLSRRKMLGIIGIAPLATGFVGQAYSQDSNPNGISSREMIRQRYFPNLVLTTHENKKVRFYDDLIKDKIVLINMMYAKCEGICMPVTRNLRKVQQMLGDRVGRDIFFYSLSLKPAEDTPMMLKHYAEMHHVGPGWLFLTGDPSDLERLRQKLGFTNPDPKLDADKSQHIGMVRYGNEALQLWAACPGMANPSWIVESVSWVDWPKTRPAVVAPGEKGERK
ncbi:MAG TPA: SCO family protein [Pyrinomonadaceae bacterium]